MAIIVKEVHLSEDNQTLTVKSLMPKFEEKVTMTLMPKKNPEVRLNIRVDDDFRRQLKADAALRGITLSDLIRELGENYLRQKGSHDKTPQDRTDQVPYCLQCKATLPPKRTAPGPVQPCPACGHYGYEFRQDQEKNTP